MKPDCRNCGYRILLAKIADIHVWGEDCDKYGTDHCRKMNDKVFMRTLPEAPGGERKDNERKID